MTKTNISGSGNWAEAKKKIKSVWNKLTDDEISQTNGEHAAISTLIERKYPSHRRSIQNQLSDILNKFDINKDKIEN